MPHDGQWEVIRNARRFNVVACGRRWGKTVLGIDRIIRPALEGFPVAWFAPEYKLLLEAWREIKALLGDIADPNEQEKRLSLDTGGSVDFWAFDNNPLAGRSRKYKRVIVDEAAHAALLSESWKRAIRPTLTDYRGDAWFLSSPNGRNEFARLFDLARSGDHPEWRAFQRPTVDNPHIDPAEVESAKLDMSEEEHRQEYGAEFLDVSGAAWFRKFDATEGGDHVTEAAEFDPRVSVILGIDPGVHTGAAWMQVVPTPGGRHEVRVIADYYSYDQPAEADAVAMLEVGRRHCGGRRDHAYVDPAGDSPTAVGVVVTGEYARAGLGNLTPWPNFPGSVLASLNLLGAFLAPAAGPPSLKIHPRCRHTIAAFQGYSRMQKAGQWLDRPVDPQHPAEEMIDCIRGPLLARFPSGRRPPSNLPRVPIGRAFGRS